MNERLEHFLQAENISQAQFAERINVARAGISHILSGRNKPGYEFIVNTMKAYPRLNIEWLLTGKGKMYKGDSATQSFSSDMLPLDGEIPEKAPDLRQFGKEIEKIVIFFNDGTYREFC